MHMGEVVDGVFYFNITSMNQILGCGFDYVLLRQPFVILCY